MRARRHLQRKTPQSVVFPSPCLGHLPSPTFQNPRSLLFLVQEVQVQEVQVQEVQVQDDILDL